MQYKWEKNVFRLVRYHGAWHCFALAIAAAAMVLASQQLTGARAQSVDASMAVMTGCSAISQALQWLKLARQGRAIYWSTIWGAMDQVANLSLLLACVSHFFHFENEEILQTSGAVGVALKFFLLLDFLRSFRASGPLVRMIVVVATDIAPFLGVLTVVAAGATFFFVIVRRPPATSAACISFRSLDTEAHHRRLHHGLTRLVGSTWERALDSQLDRGANVARRDDDSLAAWQLRHRRLLEGHGWTRVARSFCLAICCPHGAS